MSRMFVEKVQGQPVNRSLVSADCTVNIDGIHHQEQARTRLVVKAPNQTTSIHINLSDLQAIA